MLEVNIEKILPVTEARDSLNKIVDEVESTDELFVVTKNGKPSAIIVGVHHLEKLTGIDHKELLPDTPETKDVPLGGTSDSMLDDGITPLTTSDDMPIVDTTPATSSNLSTATPPIETPFGAPASATSVSSTPTTGSANNGAQASPLSSPASQPISETTTSAFNTIPASTTPAPTGPDDSAVDDIFGPLDEETPADNSVNPLPPMPSSMPVQQAPVGTPAVTPSPTPAPLTPSTPPAPNPVPPSTSSTPPTGTPSGPTPPPTNSFV